MIEVIRNYFKERGDLAFAFLYGSQEKGDATGLSDVDVAVYFYPKTRHPVEYEENVSYDSENEVWGDLERLLRKEVELLVLNRASAGVAASAIRGTPIVINDWGVYLDFVEVIMDVAEEYMEFIVNEYEERLKREPRG